jgi:hypothetical protein
LTLTRVQALSEGPSHHGPALDAATVASASSAVDSFVAQAITWFFASGDGAAAAAAAAAVFSAGEISATVALAQVREGG